jgi:hypothetical protein
VGNTRLGEAHSFGATSRTYAATYTPDGQFGSGANAPRGREALAKMITDLRQRSAANETKSGQKPAPMYHVLANSYLEFVDKDHAPMEAYWMTVFGAAGQETPARVAAAGREVDQLVELLPRYVAKCLQGIRTAD